MFSGDLELLSFLANELPVSEDIDMENVAVLKAPPLPKKQTFLLVGVFSTGNNFKRRMALRRTWMQYEAVRSGDVVVRFFTGLVSSLYLPSSTLQCFHLSFEPVSFWLRHPIGLVKNHLHILGFSHLRSQIVSLFSD